MRTLTAALSATLIILFASQDALRKTDVDIALVWLKKTSLRASPRFLPNS
jgi:hypothetical protein